ncbi:MAG: DinB family protein [Candidatus Brocadiia bacterium]
MAKAAKTRLKEPIAECEARVRSAAERLSKTLSFVPDDKLNWSPAKTARTSLAIVAHCCLANRMFATVIRGEPILPMPTPEEVGVSSRKFEATVHDRAEALRLLETTCQEIVAALATMTAERFASSPNSPFGALPMAVWVHLPGRHMDGHATQIDYLQTVWGDLADHM